MIGLAAIFSCPGTVLATANSEVAWEHNLTAAVSHASAKREKILVDFYAEWCGPCKMLETEVFSKPKVQNLLSHVVCVRLDIDRATAEAAQYQVNAIPRLMLFSSDGKTILWDATGFRDADQFSTELAGALGLKLGASGQIVKDPIPLANLKKAIEAGSFTRYESSSPAEAQKGLTLLVAGLGVYQESDFKPVADLVKKAGSGALPALVDGMGAKTLAVRVGSYRVLRSMVDKNRLSALSFDPWASTSYRNQQLVSWKAWLKGQNPSGKSAGTN